MGVGIPEDLPVKKIEYDRERWAKACGGIVAKAKPKPKPEPPKEVKEDGR